MKRFISLALLLTAALQSDPYPLASTSLDPSPFNSILYAEQGAAQLVQTALNDNFVSYRRNCSCDSDWNRARIWLTPYTVKIIQRDDRHSIPYSSYRNPINGATLGGEYRFCRNLILGLAGAYTFGKVNWIQSSAKSTIQSYEGVAYAGWLSCPWWLDVSFSYSYNHVHAHRTYSVSTLSPSSGRFSHENNSNLFAAHFGLAYDILQKLWTSQKELWDQFNLQLWPFLNVDYLFTQQPSYTENGSGNPFALSVNSKNTNLISSQIGLSCNLYKLYNSVTASLYLAASYTNQSRIGGKHTTAHFVNSSSQFTVAGLFPQNNLFTPSAQLCISSPCNHVQGALNYHGSFGNHYTANAFSGTITCMF